MAGEPAVLPALGVGIGWRQLIDLTVERLPGVDFVEVVAEGLDPERLPASLEVLRGRGVPVLPHAVTLSLGGAEAPDPARLSRLAALAEAVKAPLVSDHVAFVRAGGLEAGHLMPVPRTRESLAVLVENVRQAQAGLPVPLALENIAALVEWPDNTMEEPAFLTELTERTGCVLLLDVANLYAATRNHGVHPEHYLDALPLERIAYLHMAGGVERDGVYHDSHAHALSQDVLDLLGEVLSRVRPAGVLLERDDAYPPDAELAAELAAIRAVWEKR